LPAASDPPPRKSDGSVFRQGTRVKIVNGPLKGFRGIVEKRLSKTHVYVRIDSTVVMRVEIAEAHLQRADDA